MESYKAQLFLHILAAMIGLGGTFVFPFLQSFAERKGVAATRFAMEFSLRLERLLIMPGATLVFLFGLGLIFDDGTGYKDDFPGWLMIAIALFVAVIAVAWFVIRPIEKRALAALDGLPDSPGLPAAYLAESKRIQMFGGMLGLGFIVIVFLMTWKPGQ